MSHKTNPTTASALQMRFLAKCTVVIGIPSLAWSVYLCTFYPVDLVAISQRIALFLALTVGGLIVLWCVPSPSPREPWLKRESPFIGSRLDGLMFYILLLTLPVTLLFMWGCINNYMVARSSDGEYIPVKVRVESIEVKHISPEQLPNESFYPIYKEVYFIAEKYKDLWVASGDVTLIEKDGQPVVPTKLRANFTVPHSEGYGSGHARRTYIEHYKMNAVMDSERFEAGKIYSGWLFRDQPADVFFTRSSDRAKNNLIILASLTSAIVIYLIFRITIGMKRQDKHWRDMKEIWTSDNRVSGRNQRGSSKM